METLYLGWNKITDINVLKDVNFKELKELYLFSNNMIDIHIFEHTQFEKLEKLDLTNNKNLNQSNCEELISKLYSKIDNIYI